MLTFEQITELVELVAQRRLQGLEIEQSGFRLKIDGQAPVAVVTEAPAVAPAHAAAHPVAVSAPAPTGTPEPPEETGHIVQSPIVGTFYRSPAPDSPAFVDVGSRVTKGQVLCIVEAMKLMNEIESDMDGVIARIYPQNAQPVEYGEPLFVIQPG
ncbi:MAG TPA: acetyl-CoA carboxylase biotin carboxyl carrier protein [Thermoanaerobaculia bacterium]|nr:acetyl-CoA carboxylase biotin carboxyl carrier protein [Thermoanaerobaculia bacterium]